ncbi:MAG: exodeoxyribonuclease V subunit gamma [Pseudomonadota bacterium]
MTQQQRGEGVIRVSYSNQTERLLRQLATDLQQRAPASPLDPICLVVPNHQVATYVKHGLARHCGIAANCSVHLVGELASNLVATRLPGVRLVDRRLLQGLVLSLLLDKDYLDGSGSDRQTRATDRPALAAIRSYLRAAGDSEHAVNLKRYQLASELGNLFEEYSLSRPEVVEAWREGRSSLDRDGELFGEAELWQRQLWVDILGPEGILARRCRESGTRWLTLPELTSLLAQQTGEVAIPSPIWIFGISYLPGELYRLLEALSSLVDVDVYALNPCQEFWEDIGNSAEPDWQLAPLAPDNPPLRWWGRPGREGIRALNELTGCDFVSCFADPLAATDTLLHRLQHDILLAEPERSGNRPLDLDADGSIRILACAGVRQEIAAVAAEILALLQEDEARGSSPLLRLNEIAILVNATERDSYLAHLPAVLGEHGISCSVADRSLSADSHVVEAVDLLLSLPQGELSRSEIMRIVTHPAVLARYPEIDPKQWLAWVDRLGIVFGADRHDHEGSYIDRDLFNWDQGIRRLALGVFMAGEGSDGTHPFYSAASHLPEEVERDEIESAGRFGLLLRSLISGARRARDAWLEPREWAAFLIETITAYLTPGDDRDERALKRCIGAVQILADLDVDGKTLPYSIAVAFVRAALAQIESGSGQFLADGVVVASLAPMRAIPFRIAFVLGLGENKFPAPEKRSFLDLRLARRRSGDVSARDRDKYLFLETILSTRERLYLSYVGRDPLTGERLHPSPVVATLEQILQQGYLGGKEIEELLPLRRHQLEAGGGEETAQQQGDDAGRSSLLLERRAPPVTLEQKREHQAFALGNDLRRFLGWDRRMPTLRDLGQALRPEVWRDLSSILGVFPGPRSIAASEEAKTPRSPEEITLSIRAIRSFLECPLQGSARYVLGLAEEDDDLLALEHEPFRTGTMDGAVLIREAALEALRSGRDPREAYGSRAAIVEARGRMPLGVFGAAEKHRHLATIQAWLELVRMLDPEGQEQSVRVEVVRLGAGAEDAVVDRVLPAIELDIDVVEVGTARDVGEVGEPARAGVASALGAVAQTAGSRRVKVIGQLEPLLPDLDGSLILRPARRGSNSIAEYRCALRAFLNQVTLAAAGFDGVGKAEKAFLCFGDSRSPELVMLELAPMSREQARGYLAGLIGEMLSRVHSYLLPCEAVFEHVLSLERAEKKQDSRLARNLTDCVEALRTGESWFSSMGGPIKHLERYGCVDEQDARSMVARRFGLFLERIVRREVRQP